MFFLLQFFALTWRLILRDLSLKLRLFKKKAKKNPLLLFKDFFLMPQIAYTDCDLISYIYMTIVIVLA